MNEPNKALLNPPDDTVIARHPLAKAIADIDRSRTAEAIISGGGER
jgi:hypothetical protein